MPVKARAASLRVRLVSREDAAALVPLFEAFYGTYFGEPVVEGTVARRLRHTLASRSWKGRWPGDSVKWRASKRLSWRREAVDSWDSRASESRRPSIQRRMRR